METKKFKYFSIILFLFTLLSVSAQESKQEIVVPLSKPGANGTLKISLVSGSIKIEGYSGKEVLITATSLGNKDFYNIDRERYVIPREYYRLKDIYENRSDIDEKDNVEGLKKISSNAYEIQVEQKDNNVEISSSHFPVTTDLEIKLPHNFSLNLKTVTTGDINVKNVKGDHEITNYNGDVVMTGISGSAVISAVNGKIEVTFDEISPNKPMSFANMNKKIDITIPSNTRANLKMNTRMGEIYTDFDVDIVKTDPEVKRNNDLNYYRVEVNKYLTAKINGGGPELNFKNFNGNIIIRKKK